MNSQQHQRYRRHLQPSQTISSNQQPQGALQVACQRDSIGQTSSNKYTYFDPNCSRWTSTLSSTSSSISSSLAELCNILQRRQLTGPSPPPPSNQRILELGQVNCVVDSTKARKQHTLDSIGREKSRSRSPIVAVGHVQMPPMPTERRLSTTDATLSSITTRPYRASLNPFEPFGVPRQQQHHTHHQPTTALSSRHRSQQQLVGAATITSRSSNSLVTARPAERVSLHNFNQIVCSPRAHDDGEIYYEAAKRRRRMTTNSETNIGGHKGESAATSIADTDDYEDQLSLDQILADIEAGKLANLATGPPAATAVATTAAGCPNFSSDGGGGGGRVADSTELQVLRRRHDYNSTASDLSEIYLGSEEETDDDGGAVPEPPRAQPSAQSRRQEIVSGFEIVWLNFTYSVEPNIFEDPRWGKINSLFHKERRMILKGISGGLKSGQMIALMGPSGAGKTCLLECISGVRTSGIGGKMFLRGRKRAQLTIVPQYDNFMPQFSVEEIIVFGSRMKNPPATNHRAVANQMIQQLGLGACRSNNIQKCSGGQRKRVAIAQELVSRPNILVLDEPTSGLDSSCCYQTMRVLRDVLDKSASTEQPMAIVTTIHQPSAKVFKMFDLVYLLGKTGYTAYSGPPDELLPTIREVTGLECPQYSNPSDYMIEMVSYDYGDEPVARLIEYERAKASEFVRDYERRAGAGAGELVDGVEHEFDLTTPQVVAAPISSATASPSTNGLLRSAGMWTTKLKPSKSDTNLANIDRDGGARRVGNLKMALRRRRRSKGNDGHIEYKNNISVPLRRAASGDHASHPFFWHILTHMHRSFLQSIRDPILNNMRILIHLVFATLLVLLYGKESGEARGCPPILGLPMEITDPNNESIIDLADNVGYLFMCIMMITYVSLMSTVLTFPIDIKVVGKEYKNGWYGTFTYFIGRSIADLPFIIIYPVGYSLITWFLTNQASDHFWRYLSFTGLIIINAINSQSFGLILGALFVNSVTAATFLGPVITIPWYLFTGFTKRVHRLAQPYRTTSKFLFTRYVFEGLLDTVYGHQRCNCSEFLEKYYELRYQEAVRLGQLVSVETLSSLDYYDGLETVVENEQALRRAGLFPAGEPNNSSGGSKWFEKTVDAASTVFADGEDLNLASLMDTNVKASSLFSFGLDFEPTCPANYRNYVVQDFRLEDRTLENAIVTTLIMLAFIRVLTFLLVSWKIRTRQL